MSRLSQSVGMPRVLVVDDSPVELAIIARALEANGIIVAGTACNGQEALALIPKLNPDVICTDLHMPVMDGMVLTEQVMALYPRPVLVLSISTQPYQVHNIMKILQAGALDVMAKPVLAQGGAESLDAKLLAEKIQILAGVKVIAKKHPSALRKPDPDPVDAYVPPPQIIGIGSSTGGPPALLHIFSNLPKDFAIPILCVQHISLGFLEGMVEWLNTISRLNIMVAEAGMEPCPGHVYFAPKDQHLIVDKNRRLALVPADPHEVYAPSINRLFSSLAQVYGNLCAGIVLSGMGNDGAQGICDIYCKGGLTIAQDEATSVIFGMPKVAIETGAVREVLPLNWIVPTLLNLHFKARGGVHV